MGRGSREDEGIMGFHIGKLTNIHGGVADLYDPALHSIKKSISASKTPPTLKTVRGYDDNIDRSSLA